MAVLVYLFMTVLYLHYLFYFILRGGGRNVFLSSQLPSLIFHLEDTYSE